MNRRSQGVSIVLINNYNLQIKVFIYDNTRQVILQYIINSFIMQTSYLTRAALNPRQGTA